MHRLGLKVAIADIDAKSLNVLAAELGEAHGESNVLAVETDVSKLDEVVRLRDRVYDNWGEVGGAVCVRVCARAHAGLGFAGRCAAQ
jgi:hypothetical protein